MKYAFIKQHSNQYAVRRLCQVLGVHSSGYYAWKRHPYSERYHEAQRLITHIRLSWLESGRVYSIRLMCRCLQVLASGYYAWKNRPPGKREQDNHRLLRRIEILYQQSDGVMGSPRMFSELRYPGETCSKNRVARLMRQSGLQGIPQKRRWKRKKPGERPIGIGNHLQRDFSAQAV